jgi:MSHA biogenesis protein MshL
MKTMIDNVVIPRSAAPLAATLLLATLTGCAAPRAATERPASISLSPVATAAPAAATPASPEALPALAASSVATGGEGGRRIESLQVKDQDISLVVRGLAESYGLDYRIDPGVQGRVTAQLRDVTLTQALDALVVPSGFEYQIEGTVLRITPARLLTRIFPLDYVSVSRFGVGTTTIQRRLGATGSMPGSMGGSMGGGLGGFGNSAADVIQTVTLSDLWEEIRVALDGLIFETTSAQGSGGAGAPGVSGSTGMGATAPGAVSRVSEDGRRLIINPLAGTVMVTASPEKLEEVAAFLDAVTGSVQRQVVIEAKIVEVSLDRSFEFGIDWSVVSSIGSVDLRLDSDAGGTQLRLSEPGGGGTGINVVLRALEEQGEVSVLSSPRVSVLNNQRATFNVTTDEVFFAVTRQPVFGPTGATIGFNTQIEPQQVAVGITLDVQPQISADNTITMSVRPVITDVVRVDSVRLEDGTQATAPVIDRRETDTMVRARGGETIVIGGLMQTRTEEEQSGIPGLRSIPGLGRLFGGTRERTTKRELVIFITPRVVAGQPVAGD